jgi:hypothetical protein
MKLFTSATSSAPAPQEGVAPKTTSAGLPSSSGSTPQGYTVDDIKKAVPSHIRSNVTQDLVDNLNNISKDPIMAEEIRSNFVSYSAILKEGRFKLEDYLNAVSYVSYKIMGNYNEEAYAKALPVRYARLIANNTSKKDIASYVSSFNKGKLVNMILEQSLVPSWVLNQDMFQKALNVQADMMQNAASEKVRVEAANSLLTHLAKPKDGSFQISIGETENAGMREMRDMLREVAANQRAAIEGGHMKTIDVAAQRIQAEDAEESD